MTLEKNFDPAGIETRWYEHWEKTGQFRPERGDAEPYTIVNPPPNVTGSLHIGHALDNTLQDIIIRHERLKGKDALWVVGMDHAGIATQMVVERQMNERQQKRTDFTREEFVAKVWEWKEESGGAITRQLRRLGCSMDWANERFTMDEGMNECRAQSLCRSVQGWPDLSRQAAGQLGSQAEDRDQRSGSRNHRYQGILLAFQISARRWRDAG